MHMGKSVSKEEQTWEQASEWSGVWAQSSLLVQVGTPHTWCTCTDAHEELCHSSSADLGVSSIKVKFFT
jgi:hypothetical protein